MQRQFGRLMKRSADDSQVAILLKDFEEADKILGRVSSTSYYIFFSQHHALACTSPAGCDLLISFRILELTATLPHSDRSSIPPAHGAMLGRLS